MHPLLGERTIKLATQLSWIEASDFKGGVHHAPVFGWLCQRIAVTEAEAVNAYLHCSVADLISVCVRLVPLESQRRTNDFSRHGTDYREPCPRVHRTLHRRDGLFYAFI
ncbi:MAG: urease accessory UreF family protein [Cyanobacteriota/Melainabacteria group bacterium]